MPANDYRFIDPSVTISSQGSGLSGNAVLVAVALFKTLMSESSVTRSGHVWDGILVTLDGFGGLTCESCRKNLYCQTDRASLGRDPRDR